MKNRDLIIYRVVTGLFSLIILMGAIMYFIQFDMVSEMFISLGVPTEIIYPLAFAKILGIIAILFINNTLLKNLAYLGFAIDLVLAIIAHLNAGDGGAFGAAVPLVLLAISFFFKRKLQAKANTIN
ncbi:DoxX family protein [Aquimarina rhabdastrellae]